MTDLMEMNSDASAAVDMPPGGRRWLARTEELARNGHAESSGAVVEILSGPNAGHIASMHKPEFVFGKLGATVAAIRREGGGYRLVAIDRRSTPLVNGQAVAAEGAVLAFGDTIDVAGVKLRFDRGAAEVRALKARRASSDVAASLASSPMGHIGARAPRWAPAPRHVASRAAVSANQKKCRCNQGLLGSA